MKFSPSILGSLIAGALLASGTGLHAQTSVSTVPQGYVTVIIKPSGDGTNYAVTQFSPTLEPATSITGQISARISGVTANTISNSSGGWNAGSLSTASSPMFVKIRTGAATGRMFHITANSATSLTVDTKGVDLTTLGIVTGASGDSYDIIAAHTLLSLVGTPAEGVIGGTASQLAANQVDKILLNDDVDGTPRFYYYDTTFSQWRREGSSASQDTMLISPQTGLAYYRISTTPLSMTFVGAVPATNAQLSVPRTGTAIFASYFPAATTLSALGLEALPGWRKLGDSGVTLDNMDRVLLVDGIGVLRTYYFDGTNWKRLGSNSVQNTLPVQPASTIYCMRFGSGAADNWTRSMPYSLN